MSRRPAVPPTLAPSTEERMFPLTEQQYQDVLNIVASLPFNHQLLLPDGRPIVAGQIVNMLLSLSTQ